MTLGLLAVLLFSALTISGQSTCSNCWQGITPLHSTCQDVKKILKVEKCTFPIVEYTLPEFRAMIEFENEPCAREAHGWRVSPGTVTAISLSPLKAMLPSDFGLDLSKYEKRDDGEIVGVVHYENRLEGVTAILYRGFVQTLYLYPRASDEKLRCQPNSVPKAGRELIVLKEDSDLTQIWLRVQPQTRVPLRLPAIPSVEENPLFAIIESALPSAYKIQLAFTRDCIGSVCHYGRISGRVIKQGEGRPRGAKVVLATGRVGYFVRGSCTSRCLDSTVTWDEGAYRYTVGLKSGTLPALKQLAKSAISQ